MDSIIPLSWKPGLRVSDIEIPNNLSILFGDGVLIPEMYGSGGDGVYFKVRMPGGGTIEVHLLREDYF